MTISMNIKNLRLNAGMTQAQLAEKVGVTRATVTQWETGWSQPRMGTVEKIADVFQCSLSDIVDEANKPSLKGAIAPNQSPKLAYAPLLGRVHAGDAQEPDIKDGQIPIPAEVLNGHPSGYFLEVEGNCMSKVYPEGCLIFIDPEKEPVNGSVAVVSLDGSDFVMRRLYRGATTMVLSPDSWEEGHEDIVVTKDDGHVVELAGTVVWFQSREEME